MRIFEGSRPAPHGAWRRWAVWLLALSLVLPVRASASAYVVGAGDQLYVDFPLRGSPSDLQPLGGNGLTLVIVGEAVFFRYTATVAPDGYITLPSMDPLRVDGLTLEQVRDALMRRLKNVPSRETVSVILARPNSSAFVVSGEVQHPGRYVYERPTTIMEAIATAGGPTDHAKLKKVLLIRGGEAPQTINLSDHTLSLQGIPSISIRPSDTIIVPRRFFGGDTFLIFLALSMISTASAVYAATK